MYLLHVSITDYRQILFEQIRTLMCAVAFTNRQDVCCLFVRLFELLCAVEVGVYDRGELLAIFGVLQDSLIEI